ICPWTWITSRWLVEVAEARNLSVTWRPYSLKVLNEGNASESHAEAHRQGHRMGRVIIAARQLYGDDVVGTLYTALGNRLHPGGRTDYAAIITESLGEADLTGQVDISADSADFDAELVASTQLGIDTVGPGVGVPIIAIDGVA